MRKSTSKKNKLNQNKQGAYSVIELMLAVFIFTITITGIVYLMIDIIKSSDKSVVINQATSLAAEGLEVVKSIAIEDYESDILSLDNFSGSLSFDAGTKIWSLTPGTVEDINSVLDQTEARNFKRVIYIDELTADETATSSLKHVQSVVTWNNNQSTTTLEMVISNWTR